MVGLRLLPSALAGLALLLLLALGRRVDVHRIPHQRSEVLPGGSAAAACCGRHEIVPDKSARGVHSERRDKSRSSSCRDAHPIPDEQRKAGFGGINRYRDLEGYDNSALIISSNKRLDVLTKQIVVQSRSLDEIALLAKEKEELLKSIPAIQPIKGKDLTRMASGYGYRSDPFTKVRKFHFGMDFTAPRGTPVYASGDGRVTRADNSAAGYGKHIRIEHGFGYQSLYAHLYKYKVKRGQKVKRGDLIGFVGSTGRSEAPHLHYEVFKDGARINPINFYYGNLSPEEFVALLKKSQQENESLD